MKVAIHETLHERVQSQSEQRLMLLVLESWELKQEEYGVKGPLCSTPRVFLKRGNWGWANGSAVLLAARAAVVSEFLEPTSDPR